ncbi:MAG TPA: LysM peptidoglycan-binding domain-containing protein [Anaerolineales bacterium]|nr:LysM peptidoglycan-binding domain-containing protein [Anaerolineales bacterium]
MIFPVFRSAKHSLLVLTILLTACLPQGLGDVTPVPATDTPLPGPTVTPLPTRPEYDPGALVDYTAQAGDTLPGLAGRFNTTIGEIRQANPQIPADSTTMPAGMPMKIPIYYRPFWGTPYQILPDSQYIDGPPVDGFDTSIFVATHPGWLKDYVGYAVDANHTGAELVDIVATNYSISPRLLLAILEYQTGALSQPVEPSGDYPLGFVDYNYSGLYLQLVWAANILNVGYYGWRIGQLTEFDHLDGTVERPDPWQTAASVALQYYFSRFASPVAYARAVGADGLARTFRSLFGDPWRSDQAFIPVSLHQPDFGFPFLDGETWNLTGGPHSGWGIAQLIPWSALDFAPPSISSGCTPSSHPVVAMADGVVVRSQTGVVVEDLDGDGNERTGWDILYLHVATDGRASVGKVLKRGDALGYPSCEGGEATGTHVHVARKYNGEWMPADSAIPFNLEGWIAHNGTDAYLGTLTRGTQVVIACSCADAPSHIQAGK